MYGIYCVTCVEVMINNRDMVKKFTISLIQISLETKF